MRALSITAALLASVLVAQAEEAAPSRIDSITKSARDMMPAMPSMPSVYLPSMPDLSLPDFSDATGRLMTEFNTFTQQVGDALPILEQMGYEVTTFKVTWGLPPKARLRLKSNGNADIQKVNAIAAKATSGGVLVTSPEARTHIAEIIDVIIEDERLRRASAQMKAAMKEQPMDPTRFAMPVEEMALRQYLLSMDPFNFEQHSMSFFHRAGLEAWATRKSNDFGVDGFAVHSDGLIIVQCKRNSTENRVGRPTIQQFKGVVEEQNAYRGYLAINGDGAKRMTKSIARDRKARPLVSLTRTGEDKIIRDDFAVRLLMLDHTDLARLHAREVHSARWLVQARSPQVRWPDCR